MNKAIPKKEIDLIRAVADENIEIIFEHLGIDVFDRGTYYNSPCPVHLGDNSGGFSWSKEHGVWKCFTHSCETTFGQDVYGLVRSMEGVDFLSAVGYVKDLIDHEYTPEVIERIRNKKAVNAANTYLKSIIPEESFNGISWNPAIESYMVKERGFSCPVLKEFDVRYGDRPDGMFHNRIVFPVRDIEGDLVALTARWANTDSKGGPKWLHYRKVNEYLYGYNKTHEHIRRTEKIVLVEGPLGVIKLWEAGVRIGVAVFGTSISRRQQRMILASGANKIYLAFDDDEAGQNATEKVLNGGSGNPCEHLADWMDIEVVDFGDHSDLDEMSVDEIRKIFQKLKEKDSD
jgi:DNA primase